MKKITLISTAFMVVFALLTPVSPVNLNSGSFLNSAEAKSAKVSIKTKKKREKDTKQRIKRLSNLGISKSFYDKDDYGSSMSLEEMGKIVGKWIVSEYTRTGQLPSLGKDNNWLALKVNGECVGGEKICARWSSNYYK